MSLNNIELGDLVVSELYRDSLLATEATAVTVRPIAASPATVASPVTPPLPATPAAAVSPITTTLTKPAAPGSETSVPVNPGGSTPASATTGSAATAPSGINQATSARAVSTGPTPATGPAATSAQASPATGSPATPASPAKAASPPPGYKFLGNNRRNITVVVQSPGVAFLPDDQLSFLSRMLEACKMNMGDVAIVNLATAPVTIAALKQQLQSKVILLFGMEPVAIRLPMNFPLFKIQAYDDCTYLCAPSLEELVRPDEQSKPLKTKLWSCLKTLFVI